MVSPSRRAYRPVLRETFDFLPATGELPGERGEVAHACAAAVLRAGRTGSRPVSYTHLRAHETRHDLVCRLLLPPCSTPLYSSAASDVYMRQTGELPGERGEVAHACAAAVLRAGRTGSRPAAAAVGLADTVGLDELARLWRDSAPYSLPGVLWSLYVLRAWCRTSPQEVAQIYAAGRHRQPVEEVVAGVADPPGPTEIMDTAEAVLTGAFSGDFGVALERAAAFHRIVAAGRADVVGHLDGQARLAEGNLRTAAHLTRAAAAWRAGELE